MYASEGREYIKRLIAKGGEAVEIRDGKIYINGGVVTIEGIEKGYYYNRGDYGKKGEMLHVPENHCYLLGDNSASSYDSRFHGYIPIKDLLGKVKGKK